MQQDLLAVQGILVKDTGCIIQPVLEYLCPYTVALFGTRRFVGYSEIGYTVVGSVKSTVNSLLNIGLGESKITTLNTDLRCKSDGGSARTFRITVKVRAVLGFAALALTV